MSREPVFGLAGLLLACGIVLAATPAERARVLLQSGNVDHAARLIHAALNANPGDAALLAALGDVEFRQAEFAQAAASYRSALAADPDCARAWRGLGRIEQAEFRRPSARELFAKAYRLDPLDPEIVSAYNATRRDFSAARVASPYVSYRIALTAFQASSAGPDGLLAAVRVDGGKPLRLLLDTGASGIVVAGRAGRELRLDQQGESAIAGLGPGALRPARRGRAKSVTLGTLELRDCPIEIAEAPLAPGLDGVLGANLFEQFEIHLDARARVLELIPLPPSLSRDGGVYSFGHLLLLKTRINRDREKLFLLDTGAAFTSISEEIARQWERRSPSIPMVGAQGPLANAYRVSPVEFQLAGQPMIERSPLALDLGQISRQQGVEISGILGFSLLRSSIVTMNYRDGVVKFSGDRSR